MLKGALPVVAVVVAVVVGGVWLVVLRLKDVPPVLLVAYGLVLAGSVAALSWPGPSGRWRRPALIFGGLATLGLYLAVVFHVTDLPVLFGLAGVACLAAALVRVRRPEGVRGSRRAFLAGGAALLLSTLSAGWADRRVREGAARGERARLAAVRAPGARRRTAGGTVRVFPLHTGDTIVTYGQFYGGLDGWEGLDGYVRTLVNKTRIAVPVHAYLIDHPRHGLMLVDSGVNWEQAHDHDGYYDLTSRLLTERDEYRLSPEQDLRVQVARLGYDVKEITTVFLTHVHDDHAGGLRHLPQARVVLDRRDWEHGVLYPYSFERVRDRLSFPAFDSGPCRAFPGSQDFFGDGSVVLLPTPGHSPGHLCVLLRMGAGGVLFMGDTLYTLPHLAVDQVRQMTIGGADTVRQIEAARRIQDLLAAEPGLVPLFAHDNTGYQAGLPEIGENRLRELRARLEAALTPDWRLRPGHAPRFVPPAPGTDIGRVEPR